MAREHCIASVTCLLSGLQVFQPGYLSSVRALRVLNGVHSFQVYATEYWVDYIIDVFAANDAFRHSELLFSVVNDLCGTLDCLYESTNVILDTEGTMSSERGLDQLKEHKGLYASAKAALEARFRKGLEKEMEEDCMSTCLELHSPN